MLNIEATWSKPIEFLDGSKENLIYAVGDIERIPEKPGAYVLGRKHGDNLVPLYIGETTNLRKRLTQHLNDVWIMKGVENAPSGKRMLMYCLVRTKKGQRLDKVLEVLQKALIQHALSEGHELLNTQLTKTKVHSILFKGNRDSEKLAPRKMFVGEP